MKVLSWIMYQVRQFLQIFIKFYIFSTIQMFWCFIIRNPSKYFVLKLTHFKLSMDLRKNILDHKQLLITTILIYVVLCGNTSVTTNKAKESSAREIVLHWLSLVYDNFILYFISSQNMETDFKASTFLNCSIIVKKETSSN